MNRFRQALVSLWILCAPLVSTAARLVPFGNQIGAAKPGVVAAGEVAAGAAGTVVAVRGCSKFALSLGDDAARAVFNTSDDVALRGLSGSARSFAHLDELGLAATRPSRWTTFSAAVKETQVAKGLTTEEITVQWRINPTFRVNALKEIAETRPGHLRALHDDLALRYRSPLWAPLDDPKAALGVLSPTKR